MFDFTALLFPVMSIFPMLMPHDSLVSIDGKWSFLEGWQWKLTSIYFKIQVQKGTSWNVMDNLIGRNISALCQTSERWATVGSLGASPCH